MDALTATGQGLLGNNMFAYCNNSPINYSDFMGQRAVSALERLDDIPIPPKERKIYYSVPSYDQDTYRLCWAFCELMIKSHDEGVILTDEQATGAAIAMAQARTWRGDWNRGRKPSNFGRRIVVEDVNDLYDVLYANGPVYAKYVDQSDTRRADTHLVVVTGVNVTTNTVYTNNPWGSYGAQTFDEFLNGVAWDKPYPYDFKLKGIYLAA